MSKAIMILSHLVQFKGHLGQLHTDNYIYIVIHVHKVYFDWDLQSRMGQLGN